MLIRTGRVENNNNTHNTFFTVNESDPYVINTISVIKAVFNRFFNAVLC